MLSVKLTLFFLLCGFSNSVWATEFYEPYQSVRQLGMGGAYVFSEHDANSFMQNPAYSCSLKGFNWAIFDVKLAIGDVQSYQSLTAGTGTLPTPNGLTGLSPFYGKSVWVDAGGISSISSACLGLSAYYNGIGSFKLHNPAFPTLNTYYLTEYGFKVGGAFPISPILSIGLDFKRAIRKGGPYVFGPETLSTLAGSNGFQTMIDSIQDEGVGYGMDAGVVSRLSYLPFNPTASLSWQDLGSTSYAKTKGTTAPNRQKDDLVLGLTVDGSIPLFGFAAGLEYRHITDNGVQLGQKIHLGTELSLAFLDVRAGFYQGYTTYGVGVDLWLLQLDAALYSIEKGFYPGQSPEQRAQVSLQMNLEFDPDFNLVDAGGKRRRLKQRR